MTPSGSPASFHSSAIAIAADGSFSLGLSTTALPQAIATGTNHSGTIAGKLNGEMTRDHAERSGGRVDVDAGRGVLGEAALEQVRDAAGELGHLEAAGHLAERVGEHLAVLGGDERGDVLLAPLSSSRNAKSTWVRLASETSAPAPRPRPPGRAATTSPTSAAEARSRTPVDLPGRRVEDLARAVGRAVPGGAADEVGDAGRAGHALPPGQPSMARSL